MLGLPTPFFRRKIFLFVTLCSLSNAVRHLFGLQFYDMLDARYFIVKILSVVKITLFLLLIETFYS